MGSSGSGRLTDYPGSGKAKTSSEGGDGGSPEDRCGKAFSAQLEDVEQSAYYVNHKQPPPLGTVLEVVHAKRITAVIGDETVGNLPTKYNYLAACIKGGYSYVGTVTTSKSAPTVIVSADFAANSA